MVAPALTAFLILLAISSRASAISPQAVAAPQPTVLWVMAWNSDCLTSCSSVGMAPVMGGQLGSTQAKLCPMNDFSLCAIQNTTKGTTFVRAGNRQGGACAGVCEANGLANSSTYYCGCLPNPSDYWGQWTAGPTASCPANFVATNVPFGIICRVNDKYIIAGTDVKGILGLVGDDKCRFKFKGVDGVSSKYDKLCVRSTFRYAASVAGCTV